MSPMSSKQIRMLHYKQPPVIGQMCVRREKEGKQEEGPGFSYECDISAPVNG